MEEQISIYHLEAAMSIRLKQKQKNTMALIQDYHKYIDVLMSLQESLAESKIQIPRYKLSLEPLLFKYTISAKTYLNLLDGTKIITKLTQKKLSIVDVPTLYLLTRALIENYLIFFYLYIQEKDNESIIEYRNYIYEMSTLCFRQASPYMNEDEQNNKKMKEKEYIAFLEKKIKENPEFQKLADEKQKEVFNSPLDRKPAKLKSWKKLFEESKLNDGDLYSVWRVFSNYSHSEFLSIMQLHNSKGNPEKTNFFIYQTLQIQLQILAHFITEFSELFLCTQERFQIEDEQTKAEIFMWNKMATNKHIPK